MCAFVFTKVNFMVAIKRLTHLPTPYCNKLEFDTWFLDNGQGSSTPIKDNVVHTTEEQEETNIVPQNNLPPLAPVEPQHVQEMGFKYPSAWTPFSFC